MNCRRARSLMSRTSVDHPGAASPPAVERHLKACADCRAFALAEKRILEGLVALRGSAPAGVEVRERVLREISRHDSPGAQAVTHAQLGWSAAIATAGFVALAVLAWLGWPHWRSGADHAFALVAALTRASITTGGLLLSTLVIALEKIVGTPAIRSELLTLALRLRPIAIASIAVSYLMMAASIVHFVGRDLRRPRVEMRHED